jgi:hypothetical protein
MEEAEVFYLTSNSSLHPENSASDFKVSFNAPFDLTGQSIGLVDATVTKAQSNVMGEKISFNFFEERAHVIEMNFARIPREPLNPTLPIYFRRFQGAMKFQNRKLLEMWYTYTPTIFPVTSGTLEIKILSECEFDADILFFALSKGTAEGVMWRLDNVIYPDNFVGHKQQISKTDLTRPDGGLIQRFKLHAGSLLKFVFNVEFLENASKEERFLKLKKQKFNIVIDHSPPRPSNLEFKPGPSHFETPSSLISHINKMAGFAALAKLQWDKTTSKAILTVKPSTPPCLINFGGLERHLGFTEATLKHGNILQTVSKKPSSLSSSRPPDMTGGTHHLFVYCSLGKQVGVNERMLQLVASLDATKGGYGQQVQHTVPHPLFVSCVGGPQQVVEVTIANDVGTCEGLLMGRTTLTFEKRRQRT